MKAETVSINREPQLTNISKNYDIQTSIWNGFKWSTIAFPVKILTFTAVSAIAVTFFPGISSGIATSAINPSRFDILRVIIVIPFIEEIIVRLGVQKGIEYIQSKLTDTLPTFLTSKTARIVFTGIIFASLHVYTCPILSVAVIAQVAFIILFPVESILFEEYGFVSAYTAHATHNALVLGLRIILRMSGV